MASRMLVTDLERKFDGAMQELREVEQILGEALGYPRYADDPKNFPDATEEDGVCVGEMTPALLAKQLAEDHALLTKQNTSFLVQAMDKGTKLSEAEKKLAELLQAEEKIKFSSVKEKEMATTPMLKIEDAAFLSVGEESSTWYPALVEVNFNAYDDGEIVITTPTDPSVLISITAAEWREVVEFVTERMTAHGE